VLGCGEPIGEGRGGSHSTTEDSESTVVSGPTTEASVVTTAQPSTTTETDSGPRRWDVDTGIAIEVTIPSRLIDQGDKPISAVDRRNGLRFVHQWIDPNSNWFVGISVQTDPGSDAAIYQQPAIGSITARDGTFRLIDIGPDKSEPVIAAICSTNGYLIEITGGQPAVTELVQTFRMLREADR
jgi:hypothetical protein